MYHYSVYRVVVRCQTRGQLELFDHIPVTTTINAVGSEQSEQLSNSSRAPLHPEDIPFHRASG